MVASKHYIPIARTFLTELEIESVLEPLRSGWLVQGPKVLDFENKWMDFTGVKNSAAVTSCTTALHLSLATLGFKAGDEAIIPALTWVSTANVVEHLGGNVIFCDIDPKTFNIDVNQLEEKMTPRTKAIIPVHLFGLSADMDPIMAFAKKHGLWVIEDAACGFGARYKGQHVGGFGDAGCFSFHPRKAITTGEGGMVTANDKTFIERLRRLRDHGAAMSDLQRHLGARPYLLADHPDAGYNQRMTDIQAALGAAQMVRAADIVADRQRLAKNYDQAFADLDWLRTPSAPDFCEHGYQSYPCVFQPESLVKKGIVAVNEVRNKWMDRLHQAGVATRPATHAVHMLSYYKGKYGLKREDYSQAWMANDCSISLPLFNGMSDLEQNFVIEKIRSSTFD